jgi:hypothetical protein
MEEQQSQKRGLASDGQKQHRAREGYDPLPASNEVAGAFGEHKPDRTTDQDASLDINTKKPKRAAE